MVGVSVSIVLGLVTGRLFLGMAEYPSRLRSTASWESNNYCCTSYTALSRISPRIRVRVSVSIVVALAPGGYSWI